MKGILFSMIASVVIMLAGVGIMACAGCKSSNSSAGQPSASQPSIIAQLTSPQAQVTYAKDALAVYDDAVADGWHPSAAESDAAEVVRTALNDINATDPSATNYAALASDVFNKAIQVAISNAVHKSASPASGS